MLIHFVLSCTGIVLRQIGMRPDVAEHPVAGRAALRSAPRWACRTTARAVTRETTDSAPMVGACWLPVPQPSTAERSSSAASSPCRHTGKPHVSLLPHFLQSGGRMIFALNQYRCSTLKELLRELRELILGGSHGAPATSASWRAALPPPPLGSARGRATRESRWPSPHTVPAVSAEGTALATVVTHDKHENVKNFCGVT